MAAHLLLISERENDLKLGENIASATGMPLRQLITRDDIRNFLVQNPDSILFWDADGRLTGAELLADFFGKWVSPPRVFAITDEPLSAYPLLFRYPAFGHHVLRQYPDPLPSIYSKLVSHCLRQDPFGLAHFFPGQNQIQRIAIKHSKHRKAAADAIQNLFVKHQVNSRIATLVATAADELVMNAIFSAPVLTYGTQIRKDVSKDADFELKEKEHVQLEVASDDECIALSVTDRFGSLKRNMILDVLKKDYRNSAFVEKSGDKSGGLGLHGIIHSGLSLLIVSKPKVRTEVTIFVPKTQSYKRFKSGFRFTSMIFR